MKEHMQIKGNLTVTRVTRTLKVRQICVPIQQYTQVKSRTSALYVIRVSELNGSHRFMKGPIPRPTHSAVGTVTTSVISLVIWRDMKEFIHLRNLSVATYVTKNLQIWHIWESINKHTLFCPESSKPRKDDNIEESNYDTAWKISECYVKLYPLPL